MTAEDTSTSPRSLAALTKRSWLMAPGIIIAAVFTILYGKMMDRHGFLRSVLLPLILFITGCIMLTLSTSAVGVFVGSVLTPSSLIFLASGAVALLTFVVLVAIRTLCTRNG